MNKKKSDLIESSLVIDELKKEKPSDEFIINLWKYVLFGYNETRKMPECFYCGNWKSETWIGEFTYKGLGGIKTVGMGKMFILSADCKVIYKIPNIYFHYFYTHHCTPDEKFQDAVLNGPKPETEEYIKYVSAFFDEVRKEKENRFPNGMFFCEKCGKKSWSKMAYVVDEKYDSEKEKIIQIYKKEEVAEDKNNRKSLINRIFKRKKNNIIYEEKEIVEICLSCLKYVHKKI